MRLSLTIPALEEKPLIVAETRPAAISQFIASLSQQGLLKASTLLMEELSTLNRQKMSPEIRTKALEIYRPAIFSTVAQLATHYLSATLPLSKPAQKHAALAEALWLELGYGYKQALLDKQHQLFSFGSSHTSALLVQRAMESLRHLLLVYYQTYFTTLQHIWLDLHQLYHYAAQASLQNIAVSQDSEGHGDKLLATTISLTYKQALILAIAEPQHLSTAAINIIDDYAGRFAQHAHLQSLSVLQSVSGIFLVNPHQDKAPVPYIKSVKNVESTDSIFLMTSDLIDLVNQHATLLQSRKSINGSGLPDHAIDPHYADVLNDLIKHLSATAKRVYKRTNKTSSIELGIGMIATHYFVSHDSAVQAAAAPALPANATEHVFKPSRWQLVNISAGGMAMRKLAAVDEHIRLGELICLKDSTVARWSIGVICWANINDQYQLNISIRLISPNVQAASAQIVDQSQWYPVLLLPEVAALKQQTAIIAECGVFSPAQVLMLTVSGKPARIMLTKMIERSACFERFLFSYF